MEEASHLPKHLQGKFCPYLPPAMLPEPESALSIAGSKGQPGGIQVRVKPQFFECQGENCALWDSCQGDDTLQARIDRAKAELSDKIKKIKPQIGALIPLIEPVFPGLKPFIPIISRFLVGK